MNSNFPAFALLLSFHFPESSKLKKEKMEWPSTSWNVFGSAKTNINMIEQAKEELEILEDQHPNKFEYLKLELRSFITFLESNNSDSVPSTSAATQGIFFFLFMLSYVPLIVNSLLNPLRLART